MAASILIDDEVFEKAAKDMDELSQYIRDLRKDILDMLEDIKTGMDTPAGRKFYNSCYSGLATPLYQQMVVVDHISQNLKQAKNMYQSVFDEYTEIVKIMNNEQ